MRNNVLTRKLEQHIATGQTNHALALMSKITAYNQATLFDEDMEDYLRFIGQFRIQYLLKLGYYREAFAWACLECELYPESQDVFAVRDSIRKRIRHVNVTRAEIPEIEDLWGPVAGMRAVKAQIERDFFMPFYDPETYRKYKLKMPAGLILYGPPGCGKTFIIRQMAKIIGYPFIEVYPSEIASTYVHGTQEKIQALFTQAAEKKPAILYFDEFESLVPSRNDPSTGHHYASETSEFLVQLDHAFQKGILVIASTNYLNRIDPAVIRPGRFDKKIYVGPPDFEARIEAFKLYLKGRYHYISSYVYLGEETENYTYAEIKVIVDEVERRAAQQSKPIGLNEIMVVVSENPPYLNEERLKQYKA